MLPDRERRTRQARPLHFQATQDTLRRRAAETRRDEHPDGCCRSRSPRHRMRKSSHAVAQRLPPQRRDPACLRFGRKKFRDPYAGVEIFADRARRSNSGVPSSSTSAGIFDSGLSFINSRCGLVAAATDRTQSSRPTIPTSWATIMTFRTNGERGDQCSFMTIPVVSSTRSRLHVLRAAQAADTRLSAHPALRFAHAYVPRHAAEKYRRRREEALKKISTRHVAAGATGLAVALLAQAGLCAKLPTGPISLINPYAAGGPARYAGAHHHRADGRNARAQPIVLVNKPRGATRCRGFIGHVGAEGRPYAPDGQRLLPHCHAAAEQGQLRRDQGFFVHLHDRYSQQLYWSCAKACPRKSDAGTLSRSPSRSPAP